MSLEQLQKDLRKNLVYPVYLLHGEESLWIDQAAQLLESTLLQEHEKAFDQQILYGMDCDARYVMEQLMLFPLMASRRVVLVREAQQLNDLKALEAFALKPAPTSILILCHKGKAMDKRLKLYDAIKKSGFILAADQIKGKELLSWLTRQAKEWKIQLEPEAALVMIELIGDELSLLHPELKKLSMSHGETKPVTPADVIALVGMSREYNVIELQNAIEAGDTKKIWRIGALMAEQKGYSLIPLIALLNGYYTRALAVKSLGQATDAMIGEAIGNKSPFMVQKAKEAARRYSLAQIENSLAWLHHYDMKAKGWGNPAGDDRALTIELLDRLLHPDVTPVFATEA